MDDAIKINPEDNVEIGGYGVSGKVILMLLEDMFGWDVNTYIADARRGARIRIKAQQAIRDEARAVHTETVPLSKWGVVLTDAE